MHNIKKKLPRESEKTSFFRAKNFSVKIGTRHLFSYGGNAANNCTVLAQILKDVTFLGTLPKPIFGNQYEFVVNDFKANNVKVSECCPIRHGDSWPEAVVIISKESGSRTIIYNPGTLLF